MKKLFLPLTMLLLLCVALIYYQMGGVDKAVGISKQNKQLLKESKVEWSIEGETVQIVLEDNGNKAITSLGAGEREKLKILVVNEDFSFFKHVKATYHGNGVYSGDLSLKKGDNYAFFLYMNDDKQAYLISTYQTNEKKVEGSLKLDSLLTKEVDGIESTVAFPALFEKTPSKLTFSFDDGSGGKNKFNPIAKYKGVLYIINQEMTEFQAIYPTDNEEKSASFQVTFPSAGIYKLWGEFQWNGKTRIFPYVVVVLEEE